MSSHDAVLSPLERDPSCCNRTNWRCTVRARVDLDAIESGLQTLGYRVACRHPRLRVFRLGDGHEVAWVVPTGRVQIRVPTSIDAAVRERSARLLHQDLARRLFDA